MNNYLVKVEEEEEKEEEEEQQTPYLKRANTLLMVSQ